MITNFLNGLAILKLHDTEPPIVAHAYIIAIPKILKEDLSVPEQEAIELLGWKLHPVYLCYYYPVDTITELGDVTGDTGNELPPFPLPLIPPPIVP